MKCRKGQAPGNTFATYKPTHITMKQLTETLEKRTVSVSIESRPKISCVSNVYIHIRSFIYFSKTGFNVYFIVNISYKHLHLLNLMVQTF